MILSEIPSVSWAHRTPGALFFTLGADSPARLAAAMREVLGWNTEERERRTHISEHLIRAEFNVVTWAERILHLYKEILATDERCGSAGLGSPDRRLWSVGV